MNARFFRVLPLFVSLTGVALAQGLTVNTTVTTRTGNFAIDVGNASYGANVAMNGRSERRISSIGVLPISGNFRVDGSSVGRIRLPGVNREAAAVTAFGEVGGSLNFGAIGTYAAGFTLRIAGQTIVSPSFSGAQGVLLTLNQGTATLTVANTNIPVATPIGLTVNVGIVARASASINANANLNVAQLSAQLTGTVRGVATGTATASVSVLCASAGISFDLRLLNTTLTPTFTASRQNGVSGSFGYRVEAVRFFINLFASLCGLSATVPVVDMTFGVIQGTRNLL